MAHDIHEILSTPPTAEERARLAHLDPKKTSFKVLGMARRVHYLRRKQAAQMSVLVAQHVQQIHRVADESNHTVPTAMVIHCALLQIGREAASRYHWVDVTEAIDSEKIELRDLETIVCALPTPGPAKDDISYDSLREFVAILQAWNLFHLRMSTRGNT